MKSSTLIISSLFVLLLFSAFGESYPFFITDDGRLYQNTTNGGRFIRPEKIEEAKNAPDSRPAEQDYEGNWGVPHFRCQASLRFAARTFSTNEPIRAKLIIRNVSSEPTYFAFRPAPVASCITVFGPQGNALDRTDVPKPRSAREGAIRAAIAPLDQYWLGPGMQRIFEVDMRNYFDFGTPGLYVLYASPKVLDPTINKYTEIESGNAFLVITNSTNSPADAGKPNQSK